MIYSGCQKNDPGFQHFFLQLLIPQFRIAEHYCGLTCKREECIRVLWQKSNGFDFRGIFFYSALHDYE
jgi:hypothetical protein